MRNISNVVGQKYSPDWAEFLSEELYCEIRRLSQPEAAPRGGSSTTKIRHRCAALERSALANLVLAEIAHVQDNAVATIRHRSVAFRLLSRAAENLARIAPKAVSAPETPVAVPVDPFGPELQDVKPEDAPAIDDVSKDTRPSHFAGKRLIGTHLSLIGVSRSSSTEAKSDVVDDWHLKALLTSSLQLAGDLLSRGSARDALNFVNEAKSLAEITGSPYWSAKVSCSAAEVHIALRQYAEATFDVEASVRVLAEVRVAALPVDESNTHTRRYLSLKLRNQQMLIEFSRNCSPDKSAPKRMPT